MTGRLADIPFGLQEWLAYEAAYPTIWNPVPYRCDKCGRGYIAIMGEPICIDGRCQPPGVVRPAAEVVTKGAVR